MFADVLYKSGPTWEDVHEPLQHILDAYCERSF